MAVNFAVSLKGLIKMETVDFWQILEKKLKDNKLVSIRVSIDERIGMSTTAMQIGNNFNKEFKEVN